MTVRCIATIATISTTWALYGMYVTLASFSSLPPIPPGLRGYLLAVLIVGTIALMGFSLRARFRAAEADRLRAAQPPPTQPSPAPTQLDGIDPETIAAARRLTSRP